MTPMELEDTWKKLNADYLKLGSDVWSEHAKILSSEVWKTLQDGDILDDNLISATARAIVFFDTEQKFAAIKKLWLGAYRSEDISKQDQLCSIIWAIYPGLDKQRMKVTLHGWNKLDRSKNYGSHMAMMVRAMDYI